jgi:microcystin-dependent protein
MDDLQRFPGEVTKFLGDVPPTGWAFLDGRGLAVAEFPVLFGLIGYRYGGVGDIFRLPTATIIGNLPRPILRLR